MAIAGQPPTTWHVDDDCVAPGSGTEADPFCQIQDCIDGALNGDECVVAPGTYFENINMLGKAVTLRSSDGPEVTTIDADDSGTVVTCISGEGPETAIDGFTITGGSAQNGGGMRNEVSRPTVTNCILTSNTATSKGGGMYNLVSSPTVTNCILAGNTASFVGGGMYNALGSPRLTDCIFSENTASAGGGMWNLSSSTKITNCTFTHNTTTNPFEGGGGMFNQSSSPSVMHCSFIANGGAHGGAMRNRGRTHATVTNCIFERNTAFAGGGAIHSQGLGTNPIFINCVFNSNEAASGGAIMNTGNAAPTVSNCTFSGNVANIGGAVFNENSSPTLVNCILWGDSAQEIFDDFESAATVIYSDVQGGWSGEGNIDADPLFVDADGPDDIPGNEDDNLRLQPGSPCIDAADNAAVPADWLDLDGDGDTNELIPVDLDGNPRFVDDPNTDDTGFGDPPIVDMGPYELQDPCADDDGDGRVTICHVPPGNQDNAHTITVSVNAVPAHLAHGDYCGPCEGGLSADLEAGRGENKANSARTPRSRQVGN